VADDFGVVEIDRDQPGEGEIAFAVLGAADLAFDRVAGAQAEAADQVRADVDVVGPGEIIGLGLRRKPKPSFSTSIVPCP
jgi:hypothetical protein